MNTDATSPALSHFQNSLKSLNTMLTARVHLTNAIHAAAENVIHAAAAVGAGGPIKVSPTVGRTPSSSGDGTPSKAASQPSSPAAATASASTATTDPVLDQIIRNADTMLADWQNNAGEFGGSGMIIGNCQKNYNLAMRSFIPEAFALGRAEQLGKNVEELKKSLIARMTAAGDLYATCMHAPIPKVKPSTIF